MQKFIQQQKKTTLVRLNKTYTNPNPLNLAKEALARYNDLKTPKNEIWIIFDHDGREKEVQEAIDMIKQSKKNIHIAFMKPCIEIWPLLHNNIRVPQALDIVPCINELNKKQPRIKNIRGCFDRLMLKA